MALSPPKWCVSISGPMYVRAKERCAELGITVSSLVESLVAEVGEVELERKAAERPRPRVEQHRNAPRVALDVPGWLFDRIDAYRERVRQRDGAEISRSDALERAILQAMRSRR